MTRRPFVGAGLVLVFTALNAGADAITKQFTVGFAAPQLLGLSAVIIVLLSVSLPGLVALRLKMTGKPPASPDLHMWRLRVGRANMSDMVLRSVLTVLAAIGFYNALDVLTLAELFLFAAIMPVLAAVISGPMLGEWPGPQVWFALLLGIVGLFFISPAYGLVSSGQGSGIAGFLWAMLGAGAGTMSMILGRRIAKDERIPLAQVFWPNLAMALTLGIAAPFVWTPMAPADLALVVVYAGVLFGARFLMIEAMRLLPAYIVTLMMNIQFVWMIGLGYVIFGDVPAIQTIAGASLVVLSGFWLVCHNHRSTALTAARHGGGAVARRITISGPAAKAPRRISQDVHTYPSALRCDDHRGSY